MKRSYLLTVLLLIGFGLIAIQFQDGAIAQGLCGPRQVNIDTDGDGDTDCIGYQWDCPEYGMEALSITNCPGYNGTHPKTGVTENGDPTYELDEIRVFVVDEGGTAVIIVLEEV